MKPVLQATIFKKLFLKESKAVNSKVVAELRVKLTNMISMRRASLAHHAGCEKSGTLDY